MGHGGVKVEVKQFMEWEEVPLSDKKLSESVTQLLKCGGSESTVKGGVAVVMEHGMVRGE